MIKSGIPQIVEINAAASARIFIPKSVTEEFLKRVKANVVEKGKQIEILAFLIGYEDGTIRHGTELLFPSQSGDGAKVDDIGSFGMETSVWIAEQSQTAKIHRSKTTVILWIHSHVQGSTCGYTSIDVHTQFRYSRVMYPGIIGQVIEIKEDGTYVSDYFTLSDVGDDVVAERSRINNLSNVCHDLCTNRRVYVSCQEIIAYTEETISVQDSRHVCKACKKFFPQESSLMKHLGQKSSCRTLFGLERYDAKRVERRTQAWKRHNDTEAKIKSQAKYRKKNQETLAKKAALYYSNHREAVSQKQAIYNKLNKDTIVKRQAIYDSEHREQVNKKQALYNKKNKDIIAKKQVIYYAKHSKEVKKKQAL
ncbi:uncharacterized protein LOC143444200 [Clavelina lepadiformis]|uniref:uncharacterized protein LOC143444200 n=1 Tax=Clavelina lepadiformis TaxID=159417 RepID=UPI0040432892